MWHPTRPGEELQKAIPGTAQSLEVGDPYFFAYPSEPLISAHMPGDPRGSAGFGDLKTIMIL